MAGLHSTTHSDRIGRKLFAWDLWKKGKQGLEGQENELKHFTGIVLAWFDMTSIIKINVVN